MTAAAFGARLLAALRVCEVALTSAAFAVLVTVVFADVAWRWLSGSGLIWAREVGVFANIVLTILGIGIASADGTHLRPRFFDRIFPAAWDGALTRLQELLTALGFAVLAWIAIAVVHETWQLEDRSIVLRWLVWPVQLVLPLAFVLGTLRHGIFAAFPPLRPMDRDETTVEVPAR
ncbi:MAG: TRAP transporter small permease [Steroidobacteraceae bacterium]|nr:TRAP transporter small permease [Nevskiaceae bacterium]MCP5467114.1 TRAP transporter small permease [Nevskiaceae bacterium]MCP5472057.1 TRAP transporter small permease [Nevskiaceae bacterium]